MFSFLFYGKDRRVGVLVLVSVCWGLILRIDFLCGGVRCVGGAWRFGCDVYVLCVLRV